MRFARFGFLLCLLFLDVAAKAQVPLVGPPPPLTSPVRDPQALEVLQKTIAVMGGSATIGQIQSVIIQGQFAAAPGTLAKDGAFSWEMSGAEFRFEGNGPSKTSEVLTGHGKPAQITGSTVHKLKPHEVRALFVPAMVAVVLFRELQDEKYSIRFDGLDTLGSVPVTIVTTAAETTYPDNVVTPQKWFFDSSTGMPVRVEFRSPDSLRPSKFISSAFDFSNYSLISGVLFPLRIATSLSGQFLEAFTIGTIQVNANVNPTDFDGPTGGGM